MIKSKDFFKISKISCVFIKNGIEIPNPITHKIDIIPIYLYESFSNFSSIFFGYKILLIKLPLIVLNPVSVTSPNNFFFSLERF